jgi:prepilin-type N-terminal cleavage/methylation domain-containing protein
MKPSAQLRRARPSRAGFTLAEVLVVILVMSGILVGMTGVLSSARRTRDQIHHIQENQLVGPAILDLIERDLRGIFVYGRNPVDLLRIQDRTVAGRDGDRIDFVTGTNSLVLTEAPADNLFLRADFNEVGYVLRPSPLQDDFLEIYRREAFGVDELPFEGGRYTFLHGRVKDFNIEVYAKNDTAEEEAEPLDEWNVSGETQDGGGTTGLPARIELQLTLELSLLSGLVDTRYASVEKRTVDYRRVIRFPEYLRRSLEVQPVVRIPQIEPPAEGQGPLGEPTDSSEGPGSTPGSGSPGGGGGLGGGGGNPPTIDFGGGLGGTPTPVSPLTGG